MMQNSQALKNTLALSNRPKVSFHIVKIYREAETMVLNPNQRSVPFWDLGKQCRPRSDAAERDVYSESSLFAYKNLYKR